MRTSDANESSALTSLGARGLGLCFAVETDSAELAAYLAPLLAPLATTEPADRRYRVERLSDGTWRALVDGTTLAQSADPGHVVATLLWDVNRTVVESSRHLVRLHAAAACEGDAAVVLPAAMESGKTTLVTALVRTGLRYLTDEVVAIDPHDLRVQAYPKALSLDPGSWPLFPDLEPVLPPEQQIFTVAQWQVPAATIHADATASSAAIAAVVFPRYEAGATSELTRLSRADALAELAACTFELRRDHARDLEVLGRIAVSVPCYRLRSGDLHDSSRLVLDVLAHAREDSHAAHHP